MNINKNVLNILIQRLCIALLNRIRDSEPEEGIVSHQKTRRSQVVAWRCLPVLLSACGLFLVAYAFTISQFAVSGLETFFYLGLLLIFVPTILQILSPGTSRSARIGLVCMTGVSCYLIKVMSSPLYFSSYDEFLHWRTVDDIARSGHLLTPNALLPVSPYYPGLEIVTNAFSTLSGLDSFYSGLVVVGIARLLLILVFFILNEQLLNSARMAGIATIIYMANPHFLLFDSLFAYESLALPIATFIVLSVASSQWATLRLSHLQSTAPFTMSIKSDNKGLKRDSQYLMLVAWLALVALTFAHHVTDFYLNGILMIWAVVYAFQRLMPLYRSNLIKTALLGVLLTATWISFQGNPVVNYITSFMANALNELAHIVTGGGGARQLFVSYNGQSTALWERIMTMLSVTLILGCLPFGLLCAWQRHRFNSLIYTLGILSLFYPISQVFRFTNSGAQLADRSAAFLFISIATLLAIFITHFWPIRRWNWKQSLLLTSALSVILVGGIILGAGPALSTLPGPYEVGADTRSIEPDGIQAALWTKAYLGPNNRIASDRTDQVLMGSFGDQRLVTTIEDNIDVSQLFFSSRLGPGELKLLRDSQTRYLVIDLRVTQSLPVLGFYFVEGEPGSYHRTTPIALKTLTKFNTIAQVNRVFDNGNIVIYDAEGLLNAPK